MLVPRPKPGPEPGPTIVKHVTRKPVWQSSLDEAPPEVREFLGRVLEKIPEGGTGVTGYQFPHWEWEGKPTHEAVGLKAIPGADPQELIARVMDVDGYEGHIAHVEASRSEPDPAFTPPEKVRFFQVISVPRVAKVQQELVLVDAGTVKGYRVAYWYLLKDKTRSLDPKVGARSEFNIGAWLVAPGVVGYALSSWPRRDDVNALQWVSLTSGENALAKKSRRGQHRRHGGVGEEAGGRGKVTSAPAAFSQPRPASEGIGRTSLADQGRRPSLARRVSVPIRHTGPGIDPPASFLRMSHDRRGRHACGPAHRRGVGVGLRPRSWGPPRSGSGPALRRVEVDRKDAGFRALFTRLLHDGLQPDGSSLTARNPVNEAQGAMASSVTRRQRRASTAQAKARERA